MAKKSTQLQTDDSNTKVPAPKAEPKKKAVAKVEETPAPTPKPEPKKKAVAQVEETPAPAPKPEPKKKAVAKVEETPAPTPKPEPKKKAVAKVEETPAPALELDAVENKIDVTQKTEKTNGNDKKLGKGKSSYPDKIDYRLEQIYFKLNSEKVEGIYVSHMPNIRYLTNFSGSDAHLFIFKDKILFVTDDRYEEQIKTELYPLPNLQTLITRDVWGTLINLNLLTPYQEIGFESDVLSYQDAVEFRNRIRPVKFKPIPEAVEPTTRSKAPEELDNIRQACTISEKVFNFLLNFIKPGMSEKDIAIEIAYQSRKMGSEGDAFDIIVTSGSRGALVHGQPSEKKIRKGDIVIIDFGCKVNGFCSDITRTICVGAKPTKEQKSIYSLLRTAQKKAIETMRPGINGKILDGAARKLIQEAGYGDYFKHSLGHGIGIVPHEKPTITFRMDDQNVPEDAVVAIEPGIYIPEKFGMRVEDNVHLTKSGPIMLTNAADELIYI